LERAWETRTAFDAAQLLELLSALPALAPSAPQRAAWLHDASGRLRDVAAAVALRMVELSVAQLLQVRDSLVPALGHVCT
jgi:hypothetical protein